MPSNRAIPSIQTLKRTAKKLAAEQNLNLTQALDRVANDYGYTHWTLLVKYFKSIHIKSIDTLWSVFLPGEMFLLTAAEGAGKMSLALNISAIAAKQNVPVHYFSMHLSRSFILSRLHKIADPGLITAWKNREHLNLYENEHDEKSLLKQTNACAPGSLLVIDYLQAIPSPKKTEPYHAFLQDLKTIALQQKLRILILSQVNDKNAVDPLDCIAGGRTIARHFSHAIHLEQQKLEGSEQRSVFLVKSIHYQTQKTILQFDNENFRFI